MLALQGIPCNGEVFGLISDSGNPEDLLQWHCLLFGNDVGISAHLCQLTEEVIMSLLGRVGGKGGRDDHLGNGLVSIWYLKIFK